MVLYNSFLGRKKTAYLFFLYGIIALSLLSPIASNIYLPSSPDYSIHIAGIIQAKMALLEGQFPIRIAPWQHEQLRYPFFQFYGNLPYTLAGILNLGLIPNPFIAFKFVIWLALTLSGLYVCRLSYQLTDSLPAALLAGVAYIVSPYFIINIDVREDFAEAIAQGILPIVLFYTLNSYFNKANITNYLLAVLAWFALIVTHIITFAYASIFIALLLGFFTLKNLIFWKRLLIIAALYCYACLLAIWYIAPIVLIEKFLFVHNVLGGIIEHNWLTPLPELLSSNAVSPMPLPGNGLLSMPLYPAVGWVMLIGVGVALYQLFICPVAERPIYNKLIYYLLTLFFLILILTWSPVNIWKFLPLPLTIVQFSYRFLTYLMLIGAYILAYVLARLFTEKTHVYQVAIGILLIGLASASWLTTNSSGNTVTDMLNNPDFGYSKAAYLVDMANNPKVFLSSGNTELPFTIEGQWLSTDKAFKLPYELFQNSPKLKLHLEGNVPTYAFKKPITLFIKIDGNVVASKELNPGNFVWDIAFANLIKSSKSGYFILEFIANKYFIPSVINAKSNDNSKLAITVNHIRFTDLSPKFNSLSVEYVRPNCKIIRGGKTICNLTMPKNTEYVQLPILYYPGLLNIKVNNQKVDYFPSFYHGFILTSVNLPSGTSKITIFFQGFAWANWLSIVAWLGLFSVFFYQKKRNLIEKKF